MLLRQMPLDVSLENADRIREITLTGELGVDLN
jgi:hypothetical protein